VTQDQFLVQKCECPDCTLYAVYTTVMSQKNCASCFFE